MKRHLLAFSLAILCSGSAVAATTQAQVNETLRTTPAVYNGLFTAALIKHIVDTCPAISPPGRFARTSHFLSLYNRARNLGFSRAQIEAFVEDKQEQARLKGIVEAHLQSADVDPTNEAAVCAYAQAQIAERSALGRQLRER
ncbi:DUF5333 family protein [Roseinatronobacter monicus]|uniref:Uncharacterized protein n=1 Tax=Roseinatronobacter monicus TaxID=393481 RepID=A0A543KD57_9RHOB|nr:DUF5333 family protein [Roseinatronobacter monicus]TQM93012.1 hypothetical protein BD293_1635 [Roseinatronobacter monicus]